jgi:hypothetical protein
LRAENLAVDGHRARAGWRASRVRRRHAPAAAGDLGCARLRTYRTSRSRDGETVPGRNRAVARVLAHRGPMKWRSS